MPPTPEYPGVYVEEVPSGVRTIEGAKTSVCVFVGRTTRGPLATEGPTEVFSFAEFEREYGGWHPGLSLPHAIHSFFQNGGGHAVILRLHAAPLVPHDAAETTDGGPPLSDADYLGNAEAGSGLHAVRRIPLFNLLCIPPDAPEGDTSSTVYRAALELCVEHHAMLLVDAPAAWNSVRTIARNNGAAVDALGLAGEAGRNAALYFPRLLQREPGATSPLVRVPSGAVAGLIARTDGNRGVWKAPAGIEAELRDVAGFTVALNDAENGEINPLGVNALREFPVDRKVVWGARTLRGADAMGDEYKYVSVRRTALHIEQSVSRGMAWAVFEPNGQPLWAQLRLNVGMFMHALFRQGAFQGTSPRDAYFVKCDAETTTQADLTLGLCNLVIGFAPLKPAEFVVLRITQKTLSPGR